MPTILYRYLIKKNFKKTEKNLCVDLSNKIQIKYTEDCGWQYVKSFKCLLFILLFDQAWPCSHSFLSSSYHTTRTTKLQINTLCHIFSLPKTPNENAIRYQSASQPGHKAGTINDSVVFQICHQMTSPINVVQVRSFSLVYVERNQMNREWKMYVMQLK